MLTIKLLKKIWVYKHYLLALLILFFIYTPHPLVNAQLTSPPDSTYINNTQMTRESWSFGTMGDMISSGAIYMRGAYDENGNKIQDGGAQVSMKLTGALYALKPVSGQTYIADLQNRLHLASPVYAAGSGFDFLEPTLAFWKVLRNLAYLFYIIVFIAVGFMILFRTKINPQTVVGIENALPRIIVSLMLVTFSYAICGFLVDFVYLGNSLVKTIFTGGGLGSDITSLVTGWSDADKLDIFFLIDPGNGLWGGENIIDTVIGGIKGIFTSVSLPGKINGILELVIAFVLLSTTIKIFFALLTRYVSIFLLTIFSPLAILWNALPGQSDTAGKFFKNFAVAVLSFPAVYLFLNLSSYVAKPGNFNATSLPPFSLPIGVATIQQYGALIGLGMLMIIPQIPSVIEDALAVKPSGLGQSSAQELGGALRKIPLIGSFIG